MPGVSHRDVSPTKNLVLLGADHAHVHVLSSLAAQPWAGVRVTLVARQCDHYAIASWGNFSAQGRWVWWLKNWIDRSFIKRYRKA